MLIRHRAIRIVAWLAAATGAIEFLVRAILRGERDWLSDLAAPYTSARLWLAGANPYDPNIFLPAWYASGAPFLGASALVSGVHSVYPPPTLLFVLPFALVRWHAAVHAFVALGLLLYGLAVFALMRLGWRQHRHLGDFANDPVPVFFLAFALGFAPVHTAFNSENIVLLSCCLAILSVALLLKPSVLEHDLASSEPPAREDEISRARILLCGAAVTAAIFYKPTTGVFLLPWLVRERRWRLLLGVFLACGVLTVLSLAPLIAHQGFSWLASYRENVNLLFAHGGNADVSIENPENTDRIDLQLVFFALLGNRTIAAAAAAAVYLGLLLTFLRAAGWRQPADGLGGESRMMDLPLLVAAGCLTLGLLPSYTRVYAAIVLLPLVLWCFCHLSFSAARWLLLLLCDFLLNTSAIVRKTAEHLAYAGRLTRLWDFTIGGHTCWLLLVIGILLIQAVRQQRQAPPQPVG